MIETKVTASTGAAAVSGLAVWVLSTYAFHGAVPPVIQSWIYVLTPGLFAFIAGYLAPHTSRPKLPPAQ